LALASGVVLGAVPALDVEATLGGIAEALLSFSNEDVPVLAVVGLLLLFGESSAAPFIVSCSSTFFIPAIDFAVSLARFLSAFDATEPVSTAVWLVTDTCMFANAGS